MINKVITYDDRLASFKKELLPYKKDLTNNLETLILDSQKTFYNIFHVITNDMGDFMLAVCFIDGYQFPIHLASFDNFNHYLNVEIDDKEYIKTAVLPVKSTFGRLILIVELYPLFLRYRDNQTFKETYFATINSNDGIANNTANYLEELYWDVKLI